MKTISRVADEIERYITEHRKIPKEWPVSHDDLLAITAEFAEDYAERGLPAYAERDGHIVMVTTWPPPGAVVERIMLRGVPLVERKAEKPMAQLGRLALRREGTMWNAYYAMPDTMEGALFLGGIAMRFVEHHAERRKAFIDICREAVADIIQEATGERPVWGGLRPGPEHERGGHA